MPRSSSAMPTPCFSVARTPDVIWCSVLNVSTVNRSVTSTLPISAMRPMSLRIRSTIIRFSARCLTSVGELLARQRVGFRRAGARRRALHRPRGDRAALLLDEQLGRGRQHRHLAGIDDAAVGDALLLAQVEEEGQRRARQLEARLEGEVELVDVAGADLLLHLGEALLGSAPRPRRSVTSVK